MRSIIIPEVELEIGDSLLIRIKDVSYLAGYKDINNGRTENIGAQINWKKENACLVVLENLDDETEFYAEDLFFVKYIDSIIDKIEKDMENER